MKIIDRYLLKQMAGPFGFGVVAFVLLFVSANILFRLTELVTELGLSLWTAGELFVLWLPAFVVLTFPLATLVAILVTFGRLSGDSELVAMHAGGISFRRLVVPMVGAGLLISIATAALNEFVVPACNRRGEDIVRAAMEQAGKLGEEQILLKEMSGGRVERVLYADSLDVQSGEMVRPMIVWFEDGKPAMVAKAERGVWQGGNWQLFDGVNVFLDRERPVSSSFDALEADFPTAPKDIAQQSRSPNEMTYRELREYIRYALRQDRPTVELELTLHHKFSIPFACLVLALIAPPLGMRSHRGSSSIGMGLAVLIGFGYYVIWHYLSVVAQQGVLTAFWAAWLPNIVTGAVGIALILSARK
ncbi:MAG: LptF/LptG family permease [Armatimonadetes bacterium]|nr:LptF/LptG family permease [Armatimonadota bacterium]